MQRQPRNRTIGSRIQLIGRVQLAYEQLKEHAALPRRLARARAAVAAASGACHPQRALAIIALESRSSR